ncbi:DUF1772 domain-containing protein [Qipengyuania sp. G39]|uniref:DUF1772 domain-containing protein n=1 Tax=Qipengyuania profundimaris TaxID=3067652 RepID=A0ABT9HT37_9SPHN|nr:DUF1772 domain-containing protein [Qipengyuania sp. G39]MDP4576312.1 DUF1772 domain-containing protein [Qipengyuania sp. G39]
MLSAIAASAPSLFRNFPQPPAEFDLLDPSPHHFFTYYSHIALGTIAVLAALVALYAIKGSTIHRTAGKFYLLGMGIAALTALLTITANFPGPIIVNAALALYAGGGAYLATRQRSSRVLRAEWVLFGLGLIALLGFSLLASRQVLAGNIPLVAPLGVGGPLLILVALDLNFLLRSGEYREQHRIRRHVSRIAWVLLLTVRNPVNEMRDVLGINQETVTFGPYLVVLAILVLFGPKARRMDRPLSRGAAALS